jgi:hypothetical protein
MPKYHKREEKDYLYLPYDTLALDHLPAPEYLLPYCLEIERRGNNGTTDKPPIREWDECRTILFYKERGGRKDTYLEYYIYKDWRVRWAIKYPDYPLPPPAAKKPTESITEKAVRELMHDYTAFYRKAHPRTTLQLSFDWYDGVYRFMDEGEVVWQGATKQAAREYLIGRLRLLSQLHPDIYWFYIWEQMVDKMNDTIRRSHQFVNYHTHEVLPAVYGLFGRDECPLVFPDTAAAEVWFKRQITLLQAWGIKPAAPFGLKELLHVVTSR